MSRTAVTAALAALAFATFTASAPAQAPFGFAQLSGVSGCLVQPGRPDPRADVRDLPPAGCARGAGLLGTEDMLITPDSRHVYVAAAESGAVAAFARDDETGALTPVGCVSEDGGDGRPGTERLCADGDALAGARALALSPDGRFLYVAARDSNGVAWLERDAGTGALTQRGCAKDQPRIDHCSQALGLVGTADIAASPDGRNLYAVAAASDTLLTFTRAPGNGELALAGCISDSGSDGRCANGTGLDGPGSVIVTPDGRSIYVTAARSGAVTTFARDSDTGMLSQHGCVLDNAVKGGSCAEGTALDGARDAALSGDGRFLHVVAETDHSVATFRRNESTGALSYLGCLEIALPSGADAVDARARAATHRRDGDEGCHGARALYKPTEIAVTPDGTQLVVAGLDSLASFQLDPTTGALRQTGCAEEELSYRSCAQTRMTAGVSAVVISDDGRSAYLGSSDQNAITVFRAATAVRSAVASPSARKARIALICPAARGRTCSGRLTVIGQRGRRSRPVGFRLSAGRSRTVAAPLPSAVRRALRSRSRVRVEVRISDTSRVTRGTRRSLVLRVT